MLDVLDEDHLSALIRESVTQLCKSAFSYNLELAVEGLLGITLDKTSVMLVNIKENVQVTSLPDKCGLSKNPVNENKKVRRNRKAVKTYKSESAFVVSTEDSKHRTADRNQHESQLAIINAAEIRERNEEGETGVQIEDQGEFEPGLREGQARLNYEQGTEEQTCFVYDSAPILVHESPDENDMDNLQSPRKRRTKPKTDEPGTGCSTVAEMYDVYEMLEDAINESTDQRDNNVPSSSDPVVPNESHLSNDPENEICKNLMVEIFDEAQVDPESRSEEVERTDLSPLDLSCKQNDCASHKLDAKAMVAEENSRNTAMDILNKDVDIGELCNVRKIIAGKCNKPLGNGAKLFAYQTLSVKQDCNNNKDVLQTDAFGNNPINSKNMCTQAFPSRDSEDDKPASDTVTDMSPERTDGLDTFTYKRTGNPSVRGGNALLNGLQQLEVNQNGICNIKSEEQPNDDDTITGLDENVRFLNEFPDIPENLHQPMKQENLYDNLNGPDTLGGFVIGASDDGRYLNDYKRMFETANSSGLSHHQNRMYPIPLQNRSHLVCDVPDTGGTDLRKNGDILVKEEKNLMTSEIVEEAFGNNDSGESQSGVAGGWHKPICSELLESHGDRKPKKGTFHYVVQETIRAACMEFLGQSAADNALDFDRRHRNNIVEAVCERLMTRFPELRTESRISRILNCKIRKCISNKLYYYRRNPQEKLENIENGQL